MSQGLVDALVALGVERAFGVFGGAIAPFCEAVAHSSIELVHCRHESGAAFAAIEASLASDKPTVVVSTSGPGLTNLYTGMVAARSEGAKVLFVSGCTPAAQRGRGAFQETSASSPLAPCSRRARCSTTQPCSRIRRLGPMLSRLATGFTRKNGFVAPLGLPSRCSRRSSWLRRARASPRRHRRCRTTGQCRGVCGAADTGIVRDWAGFGARTRVKRCVSSPSARAHA